MKISNEIKIGAVVLIALTLLYFGLNYLKGKDIFSKSNYYFAIYKQIDGLTPDSKVFVNGVKVGRVSEIHLMPLDSNKISIKIEILEEQLRIPVRTIALIKGQDLLGTKGIELQLSADTSFYQPGDTLISKLEQDVQTVVAEALQPIQYQIEELVKETRDAISQVQIALGTLNDAVYKADKAIGTIDKATTNIDNLVTTEKDKVGDVISNIQFISGNLKNNTSKINEILANFATISDSLTRANYTAAIQNASSVLAQIDSLIAKINNGEGSLGLLINDDKLYQSLEQAALEIDNIAEDIRLHPKRYFAPLGKKSKKNTPDAKSRDEQGRVIQ